MGVWDHARGGEFLICVHFWKTEMLGPSASIGGSFNEWKRGKKERNQQWIDRCWGILHMLHEAAGRELSFLASSGQPPFWRGALFLWAVSVRAYFGTNYFAICAQLRMYCVCTVLFFLQLYYYKYTVRTITIIAGCEINRLSDRPFSVHPLF